MGPKLVRRALEQYAEDMPPEFRELGALYVEQAAAIHRLWTQGSPTLVHGDIHDGNMFFDPSYEGSGGPGFLDWAIIGRTSCMRDVAYFLAGTLKPEDRETHLQALLDFYISQLTENGVTVPDRATLWQQYQWHVAYVWVAGVTTLAMGSEWQPINYVLQTMERLNGAVQDCACIPALRDSL